MVHVRATCTDLTRSVDWYRALGFEVLRREDEVRVAGAPFGPGDATASFARLRLPDEPFEAARRDRRPLSLRLLGLDQFKAVSDRYGQPGGENLLMSLAHLMCNAARSRAIAARFSRVEVVTVLPTPARPGGAR